MQVPPLSLAPRDLVPALKAAAELTRLRILVLLAAGELNVKDLTQILGQSQPRVSRHLKLLAEAGLVERFREGSWVYFHVSGQTERGQFARQLIEAVNRRDPVLERDRERALSLKRKREAAAQAYFDEHAAEWDRIRALHVREEDVEAAMRECLGPGPFNFLLDLGAGTGRILELMSDRFRQGLGFDVNRAMLAYARGKLDRAGLAHAQVRHGDLYHLPVADCSADAIVMHQVLHFLSDPAAAIAEAARTLAPGGRLLIVDFAPHDMEFLRSGHAHERLGFPGALVREWLAGAGLRPATARDLAPPARDSGAGKLTVSLWLAERAPARGRSKAGKEPRRLEKIR